MALVIAFNKKTKTTAEAMAFTKPKVFLSNIIICNNLKIVKEKLIEKPRLSQKSDGRHITLCYLRNTAYFLAYVH